MADANGASGRGHDGKFSDGNRHSVGRGNPNIKQLSKLQRAVRGAVTPRKLKRVLESLYDAALAGDQAAAKVWLERVVGKPREMPPTIGTELPIGAMNSPESFAAAMREIGAAVTDGRIDIETGKRLAEVFEKIAGATLVEDLARRLAEIESRGTR